MPIKITRADRINWLLAHQSLWEGWPTDWSSAAVRGGYRERWKVIVTAMKKDGIVSKNTYTFDVDIPMLIGRARKTRRESRGVK
jgi:hypothetical protein